MQTVRCPLQEIVYNEKHTHHGYCDNRKSNQWDTAKYTVYKSRRKALVHNQQNNEPIKLAYQFAVTFYKLLAQRIEQEP